MAIYKKTPRQIAPAQKSSAATIAGVPSNDDAVGNLTIFERVGLTADAAPADQERPIGSIAEHFGIDQSSLYKPPS